MERPETEHFVSLCFPQQRGLIFSVRHHLLLIGNSCFNSQWFCHLDQQSRKARCFKYHYSALSSRDCIAHAHHRSHCHSGCHFVGESASWRFDQRIPASWLAFHHRARCRVLALRPGLYYYSLPDAVVVVLTVGGAVVIELRAALLTNVAEGSEKLTAF